MTKKNLSLFNKIMLLLNILSIVCLLLSYLASFVKPVREFSIWIVALFGLAYPFLLFVNLIFVIYWLILRKRIFLYSFIVILLGAINISNIVQFHFTRIFTDKPISFAKNTSDKSIVKIISFNARVFDLYDWWHEGVGRKKIFTMLQEQSPDILCVQEFFSSDSRKMNNIDSLAKTLSISYYHIETTTKMHKDDLFGIATFSRYPIVNKGKITFAQGQNECIFSDIIIHDDTVRVFNMHLESIRFDNADYKFVENIQKESKSVDIDKGSKKILKRLKSAFIKRAVQSDTVAEYIRKSPYPVIVCGDFNDPPSSYTYHVISNNLKDAFVESGYGFGKTYIGSFPSFRIDYILHDKKFKAVQYRTIKQKLSDHFPISCLIELKTK